MGIKNLYKLIKEYAADAMYEGKLEDFAGLAVVIDISIYIYQWYTVGVSRKIVNDNKEYINHIQGAFFRMTNILVNNIKPICVFDGAPPAAKHSTLQRRRDVRKITGTKGPKFPIFDDVKTLLKLMGIETVKSASEAEAQCAEIIKSGHAAAIATEDTDALAFGIRYMICGLNAGDTITIIDRDKILSALNISDDQFLDLCILLGCDYCSTLPRIGYKRAIMLIKKYKDIETILANLHIDPPPGFDYKAARLLFRQPSVHTYVSCNNKYDNEQLRDYLINVHGLAENRIVRTLSLINKVHNI